MLINTPLPRFRVPALRQGILTYLSSADLSQRWLLLSFMKQFTPADVAVLSREAEMLIHTRETPLLLAVSCDPLALHGLDQRCALAPNLSLLADPLRRIHRAFDIHSPQDIDISPVFVFNPCSRLELTLTASVVSNRADSETLGRESKPRMRFDPLAGLHSR